MTTPLTDPFQRVDLLRSRGMTIDQIAKAASLPRSTVGDIANRTTTRPSHQTALKLSRVKIPRAKPAKMRANHE